MQQAKINSSRAFLERAVKLAGFKGTPAIRNVNQEFEGNLTFGQRLADKIAATMGSWRFIIIQSCLLAVWIVLNTLGFINHWDPYPFILLNLALSFQAAYAAPIIMMSQNRQADKDRLAAQNDFDVNKLGEIEIQAVLLHLEQQDSLLVELLQRFEHQFSNQSPSPDGQVNEPYGWLQKVKPDHSYFRSKSLEQSHRLQIEANMEKAIEDVINLPSLSSTEVRDEIGYCFAIVNIESFQRQNLLEPDYKLDENYLNILRILYKEAFISVSANYANPDVEDLCQVKAVLVDRMKYRGFDQELLNKFSKICDTLIGKMASGKG